MSVGPRVRVAAIAPDANSDREKTLATLRPYSEAWWVVHDEIETERDRRIAAKLVICRGCLLHAPEGETTGSVR
jgi:hypothetical protein